VAAQAPSAVTITTTDGRVVEGTLHGLIGVDVEIDVAGRPAKIPLDAVQYISFTGPLEGTPTPSIAPPSGSLEDALAALGELEKGAALFAIEPRIYSFLLSPGDNWADVKVWLRHVLQEHNSWRYDPVTTARYVDVARKMSADADESTHRESPAILDLTLPAVQSGRLGFGDAKLPATVDKDYAGSWADQYRVGLPSKTRVQFIADCLPSNCAVVLLDDRGRRIGRQEGFALEKVLGPGTYTLWVTNREPCVYQLTVKAPLFSPPTGRP
jgi:hypothetical protein